MEFARARTDEQRQLRRDQIQRATYGLLQGCRSHAVTLGDIARESGMAKSAVLRYFGSREGVLLSILADEHHAWTNEVLSAVAGQAKVTVEQLAEVLASAALARPVLCELLGAVASVLEHNVTVDDVVAFKLRIAEDMALLGAVLTEALGIPEGVTNQVIGGVYALSFQAWELCHPAAALEEARRREARIPAAPTDPVASLTTGLRAWLYGFVSLEQS